MTIKHRRIIIGILIAAVAILVGVLLSHTAQNRPALTPTPTFIISTPVGFLLSQDTPTSEDGLDGTFSIRTGSWDLNAGTFQYEETPVLETTGGTGYRTIPLERHRPIHRRRPGNRNRCLG